MTTLLDTPGYHPKTEVKATPIYYGSVGGQLQQRFLVSLNQIEVGLPGLKRIKPLRTAGGTSPAWMSLSPDLNKEKDDIKGELFSLMPATIGIVVSIIACVFSIAFAASGRYELLIASGFAILAFAGYSFVEIAVWMKAKRRRND